MIHGRCIVHWKPPLSLSLDLWGLKGMFEPVAFLSIINVLCQRKYFAVILIQIRTYRVDRKGNSVAEYEWNVLFDSVILFHLNNSYIERVLWELHSSLGDLSFDLWGQRMTVWAPSIPFSSVVTLTLDLISVHCRWTQWRALYKCYPGWMLIWLPLKNSNNTSKHLA